MTLAPVLLISALVVMQPPASNDTRAQSFIAALEKRDFDAAAKDFSEAMTKALPNDKLDAMWTALQKQVGKFKKQSRIRREPSGLNQVLYVTCEFERAALEARIAFDAAGHIAGLSFVPPDTGAPPPYVRKNSFVESAITVGSGEWKLPGTLTMPKGDGPFPAVVLVHGSGPQDRDESIGALKPFRDLAWGLATRGIAVLRYEKRTREHPLKVVALPSFTLKEETIDDALLAAALLRHSQGIDPKRVLIVGHSQGALLAPRMALADRDLAGIVLMAAPSRTLVTLILEQTERELKTASDEATRKLLTILRSIGEKLKNGKVTAETPRSELLGMTAGYWLEFRDYLAPPDAVKLALPILILQGEADNQVTMEDFAGWKKALAGRKDVSFKSYPKLGHPFVDPGKSKYVAEEVVADIADWIQKIR
jgi:uncharacterized protein